VADPSVPPTQQLNPASLSVEDLARLLSAAGGRPVTAEQVRADLDAGAPLGRDGRMNLVHYAAWLVREGASRVRNEW
jgi:hypothetical protein